MLKPIAAFGALVVASALVVPTVSQAAASNSVRVSYADLNLASAQGQSSLVHRIAFAARTVSAPGSLGAAGGRQRWIHRYRAWRS